MNRVILQPDGLIVTEEAAPVEEPLRRLGHKVSLAQDFRLRSLFHLLERYPLLARLNDFIPALMERFRAAPSRGCDGQGLEGLELGKRVELIGFPGPPRIEIYPTFQGIQGGCPCEIRHFQVEQLLDLPLGLGKLRHVVFGDRMDQLDFDTVFTLFELIDGITWELSFHGDPAQCALRR